MTDGPHGSGGRKMRVRATNIRLGTVGSRPGRRSCRQVFCKDYARSIRDWRSSIAVAKLWPSAMTSFITDNGFARED